MIKKIKNVSLFCGLLATVLVGCNSSSNKDSKKEVKKDSTINVSTLNLPKHNTAIDKREMTDSELFDVVQKQTFRYFWDFAHLETGMIRERSNDKIEQRKADVVATGGSAFGVMAIVVGAERGWVTRQEAAERLLKIVTFLEKSDRFHGIFPHWYDANTGKTVPFGKKDNGADLVESAFMFQGLIAVREYFKQDNATENLLREKINKLWHEAEWTWFNKDGENVLYWHWSPEYNWEMNFPLYGWNETLITYIMAASSPTHGIDAKVYHEGFASSKSTHFKNGKKFYDIPLELGFDFGGPLFFAHYSFLGLSPKGLSDKYADYWTLNRNHTLINYEHSVRNPNKFKGYSANCWGLTASDSYKGYDAHSPTNDQWGVISPTAALSSFPYTPEQSMAAMRYFYYNMGDKIWGEAGFQDAFSEQHNWVSNSYIAIDQGPIVVMMENHRTGLLWDLFMNAPEIQAGLKKLDFKSPYLK